MADSKTPKKGKGKLKGEEGRVTLQIRRELIKELESLADGEELSLSDYIRQLLKHEVVSKKTLEREFEQFRESQKGTPRPKVRGLPTTFGRLVASPKIIVPPDPFQYPDTDMARALVKRAVRQQALPPAWDYNCIALFDREGMPYHLLNRPGFVHLTDEHILRTNPFWKTAPGEIGDLAMSRIRRALQGDHSQALITLKRQGYQLNYKSKYFDLGKGLMAMVVKHWWEHDSQSVKAPTDFDELSRYYLLQKRLALSSPQFVWWVQDTGIITNHRSQVGMTPLFPFSQGRLRHIEEMCDADSAACIMNYVHAVLQTREKQSFTLEENLENLQILNSYTMYPLNNMRAKERDVVMVTMSCMASTILDPPKIHTIGWNKRVSNT